MYVCSTASSRRTAELRYTLLACKTPLSEVFTFFYFIRLLIIALSYHFYTPQCFYLTHFDFLRRREVAQSARRSRPIRALLIH